MAGQIQFLRSTLVTLGARTHVLLGEARIDHTMESDYVGRIPAGGVGNIVQAEGTIALIDGAVGLSVKGIVIHSAAVELQVTSSATANPGGWPAVWAKFSYIIFITGS